MRMRHVLLAALAVLAAVTAYFLRNAINEIVIVPLA